MRELAAILAGTLAGSIARLIMLRSDYRQYPSFPHGYVIHMSLGVIAALSALLLCRHSSPADTMQPPFGHCSPAVSVKSATWSGGALRPWKRDRACEEGLGHI